MRKKIRIDILVEDYEQPSEYYKLVDEQGQTIAICASQRVYDRCWSLTYAGVIKEALESYGGL